MPLRLFVCVCGCVCVCFSLLPQVALIAEKRDYGTYRIRDFARHEKQTWKKPLRSLTNGARVLIIINMRQEQSQTEPITEPLKRAIEASGMSLNSIETATGVKRASLMRFLRGESSLRLDLADKLASFFNLSLQAVPQEKPTSQKKKVK
jgi:hypothetical protein